MTDYLVELGANANARRIVKALGLPLPMPQKLVRGTGPWADRPLEGKTVVVVTPNERAGAVIADTITEAGATPAVEGAIGADTPWADAAAAWGRPATALEPEAVPEGGLFAIVIDATEYTTTADLQGLRTGIGPRIKAMDICGRILVIGRPHDGEKTIEATATHRALEGFVRALAREVGGKGITANFISVRRGSEKALAGPLRWLLSARSAFLSSQAIHIATGRRKAPETPWTAPLDGKVALLTGAARGIGAATAATLAREGAKVICLDRPDDAELLAEVARDIGGIPLGVDITDPEAGAKIAAVAREHGGLDIIVHNAGITRDKTLARMDDARWDLTMAVNLDALIRVTAELDEVLHDGGRVIALSSVSGIAGNFGQTNYSASKSGVIGFIEASAAELGKRDITVTGIAPGFIETRLTAAIPGATREAGRRMSCLVQGGLPIDIAEAVTFLATPGSWGVHGEVIRVCGGAFIGA